MLSVLATSLILGFTLLGFLTTLLVPVKGHIGKFFRPPNDEFISARNSQSWLSIGFSIYAGAVGTWVLTAPPESAIYGGWWANIGYALGCGCPWAFFVWTGPKLKGLMQYRGFTCLEFVYERYGRPLHAFAATISILYVFGGLILELTLIQTCLCTLCPTFPPLAATLSIALVTNFYTAVGGFPASMFMDKVQGVLTVLLISIAYGGGVFGMSSPHIDAASWSRANVWKPEGLATGFALLISVLIVEQLNQSYWQRVFAARTDSDIRWGFSLAVVLMVPSMILFGFAGTIAQAASYSGYIDLDMEAPSNAVFLLLAKLPDVWSGLTAFLGIGLVTSTANTLQTALTAIITGELSNRQISYNWARALSLAMNIPAVLIAAFEQPSILNVMVSFNTVAVAVAPPILLGFSVYSTPLGALVGAVAGVLSVFFCGAIFTRSVIGTILWPTFPELYNWKCLVTFIVIALTATAGTLLVSAIEIALNPTKRQEQINRMKEIKRRSAEAAPVVEAGCADSTLEKQNSDTSNK